MTKRKIARSPKTTKRARRPIAASAVRKAKKAASVREHIILKGTLAEMEAFVDEARSQRPKPELTALLEAWHLRGNSQLVEGDRRSCAHRRRRQPGLAVRTPVSNHPGSEGDRVRNQPGARRNSSERNGDAVKQVKDAISGAREFVEMARMKIAMSWTQDERGESAMNLMDAFEALYLATSELERADAAADASPSDKTSSEFRNMVAATQGRPVES